MEQKLEEFDMSSLGPTTHVIITGNIAGGKKTLAQQCAKQMGASHTIVMCNGSEDSTVRWAAHREYLVFKYLPGDVVETVCNNFVTDSLVVVEDCSTVIHPFLYTLLASRTIGSIFLVSSALFPQYRGVYGDADVVFFNDKMRMAWTAGVTESWANALWSHVFESGTYPEYTFLVYKKSNKTFYVHTPIKTGMS